jgi:hypothetical protein
MWDLKGALQILYKDNTLRADIVTPKMKLTKDAIITKYYNDVAEYPYKNITIFNNKTNKSYHINSYKDANNYFQKKDYDFSNNCPAFNSDPWNVTSLKPYLVMIIKLFYDLTSNWFKL